METLLNKTDEELIEERKMKEPKQNFELEEAKRKEYYISEEDLK